MEGTFQFISNASGPGSMVVFDHIYAGVLREENKYYGEKGMIERAAKAGEKWTFAFEEGEAVDFLGKLGVRNQR